MKTRIRDITLGGLVTRAILVLSIAYLLTRGIVYVVMARFEGGARVWLQMANDAWSLGIVVVILVLAFFSYLHSKHAGAESRAAERDETPDYEEARRW